MASYNAKGNNFKLFLKENKTLAFSIPVLVILIVAAIILYSGMGGSDTGSVVPTLVENAPEGVGGTPVEVLPQTERMETSAGTGASAEGASADGVPAEDGASGGDGAQDGGAIRNPFNGPIRLAGVVMRDDGEGMAILKTDAKTIIAKKDDVLENGMVVGEIAIDRVILADNGKNIELKLERK